MALGCCSRHWDSVLSSGFLYFESDLQCGVWFVQAFCSLVSKYLRSHGDTGWVYAATIGKNTRSGVKSLAHCWKMGPQATFLTINMTNLNTMKMLLSPHFMISLAWPRWRMKSYCSSGNPCAEEHRAEPRADFGRAGCEEAAHPLLGDLAADKRNYGAMPILCYGTSCAHTAALPFSVGSGCYGVMFTQEPVSVHRNPLHHDLETTPFL